MRSSIVRRLAVGSIAWLGLRIALARRVPGNCNKRDEDRNPHRKQVIVTVEPKIPRNGYVKSTLGAEEVLASPMITVPSIAATALRQVEENEKIKQREEPKTAKPDRSAPPLQAHRRPLRNISKPDYHDKRSDDNAESNRDSDDSREPHRPNENKMSDDGRGGASRA
jgi:hypothetical protein